MKLKKISLLCVTLAMVLIVSLNGYSMNENSKEQPETAAQSETAATMVQGETVSHVNGGLTLTIPAEKAKLVLVDTPQKDPEGVLFSVSEKESVDAAAADGQDVSSGLGWLFGIRRVNEAMLHEMLCYDMSGMEVFAKDEKGNYYLLTHPTDVRIYRRNNAYNAGMEQWRILNEWARKDVCSKILADNADLTAFTRGNTMLDMYLARTIYQKDTEYTVSTAGSGALSPNGADAAPYAGHLMERVSCENTDTGETPDGEYIVLNFPKDDVRFDFFLKEGKKNYVRVVWSGGNEQLFKLSFSNDTEAGAVMQEWYNALRAANSSGNAAPGGTSEQTVPKVTATAAKTDAWHYVLTTEKRVEEEKNDAGVLMASTNYELPKLELVCDNGDASQVQPEARQKVCEMFNNRVAEFSQGLKTAKQLAEGALEQYNERNEEDRKNFGGHTEELSVSDSRQNGDLLEVSFRTYGFWGGAHGSSSVFNWHYDLSEGKFVELTDLSDQPEKLNRMIADEIIGSIEKDNNSNAYSEDYAKTIRTKEKFEVSFGADAMTVIFSQYEIASYAFGIPTFKISYDKITPLLNERGRRLLKQSGN